MKLTSEQIEKIRAKIDLGDRLIVLVDVPPKAAVPLKDAQQNIYCVDHEYVILWQVSAPPPTRQDDSFVEIRRDGGTIMADRFFGDEYRIDEKTGTAKEIGWHK